MTPLSGNIIPCARYPSHHHYTLQLLGNLSKFAKMKDWGENYKLPSRLIFLFQIFKIWTTILHTLFFDKFWSLPSAHFQNLAIKCKPIKSWLICELWIIEDTDRYIQPTSLWNIRTSCIDSMPGCRLSIWFIKVFVERQVIVDHWSLATVGSMSLVN